MKRTFLAITIAIFYMPFFSSAQIFEIIKDKAIGTVGHEDFPSLIAINDHELIMACRTNCDIDGDKTDPICDDITQPYRSDIWLVKLDTALNIIWNKSIGGNYNESEPKLIFNTATNHIFLSCISNSDSSCDKNSASWLNSTDFWIVELDTSGAIINDNRYGGFNDEDNPSIKILPNQERLICGSSRSGIGGDKFSANHGSQNDFWLLKTNSNGTRLWDKSIGGIGSEQCTNGFSLNNNNLVLLSNSSNHYYINGATTSSQNGDISDTQLINNPSLWLAKFDSIGNKIWDKKYCGHMASNIASYINSSDEFYFASHGTSGLAMSDSNNVLNVGNLWVIKIDSSGNKIWDYFYGGNGNIINGMAANDRDATKISEDQSSNVYISCTTNNDVGFDISEPTYGLQDYWLLKIDSNGNKLWDKRFGGSKNDYCAGFVQMPDSSIYIYGMSDAGGVTSMKTDSGHFYTDIWIVHFKYHDTTTVTSVNSNFEFEQGIKLFPNPAANFCTVQSSKERIKSVLVYNTVGELIDEIRSPSATSIQIPLASYAPGLYFATIKSEYHIVTKKLVIKN